MFDTIPLRRLHDIQMLSSALLDVKGIRTHEEKVLYIFEGDVERRGVIVVDGAEGDVF